MACLAAIYLLLYVVSRVKAAPASDGLVTCDVDQFLKDLSNRTLVVHNRFACNVSEDEEIDTLEPGQYCFHVYKCPLDFKEKDRHTPAICKSDGTWDYNTPLCEDLIPEADAVLLRLQRNAPIQRMLSKQERGANFAFKFGFSMIRSTTATQAPAKMELPKAGTPEYEEKIGDACSKVAKSLCHVANSQGTCKSMEKQPKMAYWHILCQICVMKGYCPKSISLFSRSV